MEIKHLIIVSLILAILTIGAVSASEDSDNLAVDETVTEEVQTSVDDVDVVADEDEENTVDVNVYESSDLSQDDDYSASVDDYDYLNGTVSFFINEKQYYNKQFSASEKISKIRFNNYLIDLDNFKAGNYTVKANYLKNGNSTPFTLSKTVKFIYNPDVTYLEKVSINQENIVNIFIGKANTGSAVLYEYNSSNDKIGNSIGNVNAVDGSAQIVIKGLAKGSYSYFLNITINGEQFTKHLDVEVLENDNAYSASVNSAQITVGDDVVVSVNGPKSKNVVYIIVDGELNKFVSFKTGSIKEAIKDLSIGTHKITVQIEANDKFFSKTFDVVVKAKPTPQVVKLTLKKVNVKKSAKKLTLQATLKINNKAKKGLTVIFKFNGKKYTARTTAKGIAKVTLSKKVLKKLKVGKKIKYQASYGKTVKKLTVKVKK